MTDVEIVYVINKVAFSQYTGIHVEMCSKSVKETTKSGANCGYINEIVSKFKIYCNIYIKEGGTR
jgi:hypothetical protein